MLYIDFTNPKTKKALAKSRDGQFLNLVGNPQFRSGEFWTKSFKPGLEIAEDTINLGTDPLFGANTSWSNHSTGSGDGSRTFGYATSVLGGDFPTCLRLIKNDGTADEYGVSQNNAAWNAVEHTFSFYFKVVTQVATSLLNLEHDSGNILSLTLSNYDDNQWHRVEATSSAANANRFLWLDTEDAEVLITGWQAEAKAYATPFDTVNLDGATARLEQNIKIPVAGNFPGFNSGSIIVSIRPDFDYDTIIPAPRFWTMGTGTGDRWLLQYSEGSNQFLFYLDDGSATSILSVVQTFIRGEKILLIITWDGTNGDLWVNGIQSETVTKTQGNIVLPGLMYIGNDVDGTGNPANSVIDEIAIIDKVCNQRLADKLQTNFEAGKPLIDLIR